MSPLTSLLAKIRVRRTSYPSAGRDVALESVMPMGLGSCPGVILLHGSDGPVSSGPYFHLIMQGLAAAGYAALFPHYLESTGHVALGSGTERDRQVAQSYLTWQRAVDDSVTFAAGLPRIDGARLALAGISLGGFLALGSAANTGRVRCVVEVCGGLPESVRGRVATMPPVLILHGEQDRVVSVERAYEVQRELAAKDLPYEVQIYPGQGHIFTREAEVDAMNRTRAFLAAHLHHGQK